MGVFFLLLALGVIAGTVIATAILGRFWRFVKLRPAHRAQGSPFSRFSVRPPGPVEYEEQQALRRRLDAPFAAVFLGVSLIVLAMPGFAELWVPLFVLWVAAAVVRWRDRGPASSFVRLGTVILLVVEALIVIAMRGGDALLQAAAYLALALVGLGILYRTGDLPLLLGPGDAADGNLPPRRRSPNRVTAGAGHAMRDALPAAQARNGVRVAITTPNRRTPRRVKQDESGVLSPPYSPQATAHYGD